MWMTFQNMIRQELGEAKWQGRMRHSPSEQRSQLQAFMSVSTGREVQNGMTASGRGLCCRLLCPLKKKIPISFWEKWEMFDFLAPYLKMKAYLLANLYSKCLSTQILFFFSACDGELTSHSVVVILDFVSTSLITLCVCMYVCRALLRGAGDNLQESSTPWVTEIKLSSSGVVVGTFLYPQSHLTSPIMVLSWELKSSILKI